MFRYRFCRSPSGTGETLDNRKPNRRDHGFRHQRAGAAGPFAFSSSCQRSEHDPEEVRSLGSFIKHPKGVEYKYYAERDDFSIERSGSQQMGGAEPGMSNGDLSLRNWWKGIDLSGSSISVSAPLRYKIGLHPHSQIDDAPAQCGDGSEWPKQGTLKGSIAMAMMPNYGVSASLRGVTVNPVDPCKLRMADMDLYPVVNAKLGARQRRTE